jgi:PAS domain S-box-containing protein
MFGTTMQAMQGTPLARYIPRDQRQLTATARQYFGDTGIRMRMKGRRTSDYAVTGSRPAASTSAGRHDFLADRKRIYTIILRDITERKQVQEQLEQSYSQLRELSAALQTIREEERKHIARELHDDLGQLLATLRGDLALLQRQGSNNAAARKLQKAWMNC